jgi:hypothetical protein
MRNLTEVTRGEAVERLGSEDGRDQDPVPPSYGCLVSVAIRTVYSSEQVAAPTAGDIGLQALVPSGNRRISHVSSVAVSSS